MKIKKYMDFLNKGENIMRKKHGVTITMLVIIVVIMATLLTIVTINGTEIYNDAQKTKLQSEINQLEILVQNYLMRNPNYNWSEVEIDLSEYSDNEKEQFNGENIVDDKIVLYVIDLLAIDAEETSYGSGSLGEKDRYLYSKNTKKIYYELGRTIGDNKYYRIDE